MLAVFQTFDGELARFLESGVFDEDEREAAAALCEHLSGGRDDAQPLSPVDAVLVEEAAFYWAIARVFARRVVAELSESGKSPPPKPPVWLEPLAKTRERLRKVVKEIEQRVGPAVAEEPLGLGPKFQPLIEEAREVLDDVFFSDARPDSESDEGSDEAGGIAEPD